DTMSMTRRLRKARFEEQATLEGFDFTASPKLPAAQIRDLAALRWLHAAESVILYGPVVILGSSLWPACFRRSERFCYRCDEGQVAAAGCADHPRRVSSRRSSRFSPWACSRAARSSWTSWRWRFLSWLICLVSASTSVSADSAALGGLGAGRAWARRRSIRPRRSGWL